MEVRSLPSRWLSRSLLWLINEDKLAFFHGQRWKLFLFPLGDSQTTMLVEKRALLGELDPFSSVFSVKTLMSKLPLNMSHEESRVGGVSL